ncbi:MAG: glycosyltransferase, partial [Candidatus Ventricola sp.]
MENGNTTMPKVWVVIPIHNAEKTLAKCLDSLMRQTMTRWTACLIDD